MSEKLPCGTKLSSLPRVMVIEDSPTILKIISKQLDELGYEYLACLSGREGVELLKANTDIRILLLDLQLNKESGLDVMYRLKTEFKDDGRTFYVIAQTAFSSEDMQTRCQNVGFSDFIPKPFTKDVLDAKLKKAYSVAVKDVD